MKVKRKTLLWIAGILVFFCLVFIAGYYFLRRDVNKPAGQSLIKPLIKDQFRKMVSEASDSLYQVRFKQFDFNTDQGTALITAFELIPDKHRFKQLQAIKKAPAYLLYYKADTLKISGFGFKKRDSVTRFDIDKVYIKNPLLTIRTKYNGEYIADTGFKEKMLFKLAGKVFKRIYAESIDMPGTRVVWVNNNRKTERRTSIQANISIAGFSTQPSGKGTLISIKRYTHSPNSMYNIVFDNIRYSNLDGRANIHHVSVMPRFNKAKFNRLAKFDKDRYHFEMHELKMYGIDRELFIKRQELHMQSFTVQKSWAEVYKDYHWPKKKNTSRQNTYPNEKIQRLAIDVKIDTIRMHNGTFYHTIYPKRSEKVARFLMTDIESTYFNVTNIESEVQRKPITTVYTTCKLMGIAPMQTSFVFNLKDPAAAFTMHSTLGSTNGIALNPLLKPLAMMEVKNGTINKMDFRLNGNENYARGNVDLYYNNLKIHMLKRDKEDNTLKNMGLVSFITNAALPNDNPGKDGKLRKGPVNRIREPKETFFGFIWYCMLDGASSAIMGYDQNKKKPNKNLLIKIGETIAGPKDEDKGDD